jgi:hypothetical protein
MSVFSLFMIYAALFHRKVAEGTNQGMLVDRDGNAIFEMLG